MKDGGPAFPGQWIDVDSMGDRVVRESFPGMSLRDYLVVHAPAQEIADLVPADLKGCAAYIGIAEADYKGNCHYLLVLAKARGEWADAMLVERLKP